MTKRSSRLVFALFAVLVAAYAVPAAQNAAAQAPAGKKAMTIADYTRWRTITGSQISSDGKWVTYGLSLTNVPQAETKPVLTILNLETNQKVDVPDATGASFSADAQWIAYTVEPGGAGRGGGRGGRGGGAPGGGQAPPTTPTPTTTPAPQTGRGAEPATPPQPRRVELRSLASGTVGPVARQWQDIQSFAFSP
ncbi:MAG TPA: hypothetical protein VFV78_06560, partial [Vicinamibacterales bacterium]|nr:hypothetical protein [Vicinamibacterales bacterium]